MIDDGWVLAKDEKVDCCVYVWARTRCMLVVMSQDEIDPTVKDGQRRRTESFRLKENILLVFLAFVGQ